MADVGGFLNNVPQSSNRRLAHAASVAAAPGDLLYLSDAANGYVKPAGQIADQGSEASTQRSFAAIFCGVSSSRQSASDATPRAATAQTAIQITNYPCTSDTYSAGDMVAPAYSGGLLSNQSVSKTTDPTRAVGRVNRNYAAATTTVDATFFGRVLPGSSGEAYGAIGFQTISAPPSISTGSAGGTLQHAGGDGCYSSASTGSAGGPAKVLAGSGGATTSGTGGAAGLLTIGGTAAGGAATTGTPGAGADTKVRSQAGGAASAGTGNGGAGGNVDLVPAAGGTSFGGTAGAAGEVQINGTSGMFEAGWVQNLAASVPVSGQINTVFMATRAYRVKGVSIICSSTSTVPTVDVKKETGTTAPGSGTTVLTGVATFSATANTRVAGSLTSTAATLALAAGDRLSVTWGGTVGSITGAVVAVSLVPI